jgi:hypothetical protein
MEEIIQDWESCEYIHTTYYEYDTGYSEYGCCLTGFGCLGDKYCPLCFKYKKDE